MCIPFEFHTRFHDKQLPEEISFDKVFCNRFLQEKRNHFVINRITLYTCML